jgi:hypothetical protein
VPGGEQLGIVVGGPPDDRSPTVDVLRLGPHGQNVP